MRCEEVREVLPAYVDDDLHLVGAVDLHLASCAECRTELAEYRGMGEALARLRDLGEDPAEGFLERVVAAVPAPSLADRAHAVAGDPRVRVALASIGTAAIGAATIGLIARRRRAAALARA